MPAEFDEEELLGFPIWVAELELLGGQIKAGTAHVGPTDHFLLLQKLLVSLEREQREVVKQLQRRCDDILFEIVVAGAPPPVSARPAAVPRGGEGGALSTTSPACHASCLGALCGHAVEAKCMWRACHRRESREEQNRACAPVKSDTEMAMWRPFCICRGHAMCVNRREGYMDG